MELELELELELVLVLVLVLVVGKLWLYKEFGEGDEYKEGEMG